MDESSLAKHGAIMVFSTFVASFFNFLYQIAMGGLLSREDFGVLYSLLSLLYIINVGSGAVQTSIARYASKLKAHKRHGRVRYLFEFSDKWALMGGVASFLLISLLSPSISQFLNIDNPWYVVSLASFLVFGFVVSVNVGLLMGLQRFLAFGASNIFWAFLKLSTAVILVLLGFGVYGGLLSLSLANVVVFLITLFFIRKLLKSRPETFRLTGVYSYSAMALLATFSLTTMTYVDVILAKHYLTPELAGEFSALAVLGQVIFFAPYGISLAMFPKTSESFERGRGHLSILLKALAYTIAIGGFFAILYLLFPGLIQWAVFGSKYSAIVPYMFEYGVAMFLFSIAGLMTNYFLSIHKTGIAYMASLALLIEVLLLLLFHSSILDITNDMLVSGMIANILIAFYLK